MSVSVTSAKKSEHPVLQNMMQLYLHDFSEFDRAVEIGQDGQYSYPYLDHYWEDPNRFPFLIRNGEKLAGFALVRVLSNPHDGQSYMELSEFFVLRSDRRQGVGAAAACRLWDLFVGNWEVDVMSANTLALPFWRKTINAYTNGDFVLSESGSRAAAWTVFRFESGKDVELPDDLESNVLDY